MRRLPVLCLLVCLLLGGLALHGQNAGDSLPARLGLLRELVPPAEQAVAS